MPGVASKDRGPNQLHCSDSLYANSSKTMLATDSLGLISFPFLGLLWRGVNELAVVVQTEEVLNVNKKAMCGQSVIPKVKRLMSSLNVPK